MRKKNERKKVIISELQRLAASSPDLIDNLLHWKTNTSACILKFPTT
jgi:hypothetical protein